MKKTFAFLGFSLAISTFSISSMAANYNFNEIYSGGGSISLAPGSDDPLATICKLATLFSGPSQRLPEATGTFFLEETYFHLCPFMLVKAAHGQVTII